MIAPSGAGFQSAIAPVLVLIAAMPVPGREVLVIVKLTFPAAYSVVPFTAKEWTRPKTWGVQPAILLPVASSYAATPPASVATNSRVPWCSRLVRLPGGTGFGVHAASEPSASTRAYPGRAMPATCVNVPPMNDPPEPSATVAVTSPSRRGSRVVACPPSSTSTHPPVFGPT